MALKPAGETLWNPWAEELTNTGAHFRVSDKIDKIWDLWMNLRIKTPIKSWNHSVRQPGSSLILRRESAWGFWCLFKQTNLINPVKVLPRVLLLCLRFVPSSLNAGWGEEVPLTNAENKSCFFPNKWDFLTFPTTTNRKFEWCHNNKANMGMLDLMVLVSPFQFRIFRIFYETFYWQNAAIKW